MPPALAVAGEVEAASCQGLQAAVAVVNELGGVRAAEVGEPATSTATAPAQPTCSPPPSDGGRAGLALALLVGAGGPEGYARAGAAP